MELKKKAVSFVLVTLGIISVAFSFCHAVLGGWQDSPVSMAMVETRQPMIPVDPMDASDPDAACHVAHHGITAIGSQSNTDRLKFQDIAILRASFFTALSGQSSLATNFLPPRLIFEPKSIQERLASLGAFLS